MKTQDDFFKEYTKLYAAQKKQETDAVNKKYSQKTKNTKKIYEIKINDAANSYQDKIRDNAVQRLVDERTVAEEMANMGLSGSGLNKEKINEAENVYMNKRGQLEGERKYKVDLLISRLSQAVDNLELNRRSAQQRIEKSYNNLAKREAKSEYNSYLKANQAAAKATASKKSEAAAALNHYYLNGIDSKNGKVSFYNSKGKTFKYTIGINPYTNEDNSENMANMTYGSFENGYQPMGIEGLGFVNKTDDKMDVYGKASPVFYIDTRRGYNYYVWSDYDNKYLRVKRDGDSWDFVNVSR